jgi:hypothetical protein
LAQLLSRFLRVLGLVDPDGLGQGGWLGWLADEPFRSGLVGGIEDPPSGLADRGRLAVVDVGGGVQPDPRMPMLVGAW